MLQHTDHFHGSDLEKIEKVFGIKKEEIISFSANVNPLGLSNKLRSTLALHLDAITSYPDREYASLRTTIGNYVGAEKEQIIVGNGSTELISLFIQFKHPKKTLILGPTYSEYEREISLGGGISLYFPLKEEDDFCLNISKLELQLNESIDLLVICNPNNPTSSAIKRDDLRKILDICKRNDIFLMIDETYIEFADEYEKISAVPLINYYNNLFIIRGISKFFAAPGLRLGYAITGNSDLIKSINAKKNPWTINSLAEIAGTLMFTDTDYIRQTKELIHEERIRICKELKAIDGLTYYEPTANFVLAKILKESITADFLFNQAIRNKMMIRNCCTFPFLDNQFFRFCFMKPDQNDQLLACIKETLEA
ncbi:MAG: histidinol-phosphate transaminase [Lachnospiraceae bacterium]|nr:histidinol-phosphate transaminase [Lachnospiraceae bacterium]